MSLILRKARSLPATHFPEYTQQVAEVKEKLIALEMINELHSQPLSWDKIEVVDRLLTAYRAWKTSGQCATPFMDWMIEQAF